MAGGYVFGTAVLSGGPRTYHIAGQEFKENIPTNVTNANVWDAVKNNSFFRCVPAPPRTVSVQSVPDRFDPKKVKASASEAPTQDDSDDDEKVVTADDDDDVEVEKPKKSKKNKKRKKVKVVTKAAEDDDDDDD